MPRLKKLLSRLNKKERKVVEILIEKIISFDWKALDVKKLKGYQNIFRARKGNIRIIFVKDKEDIFVLSIEKRREDTYKF
ncbi:MAG: type II toxin-antitoxin system RelE/ParE family toxin [Candidatus Pacebacteria bacterium]|nr:type II toxin-antitoxin system RelE/ParE family toxin [Candidatus Paceibacterota bacterium]